MDDGRVTRSNATPHTAHCLFEPGIREDLLGLAEEEEEESNVSEYSLRMPGRIGEEGEA
jgi:hypothetical protein